MAKNKFKTKKFPNLGKRNQLENKDCSKRIAEIEKEYEYYKIYVNKHPLYATTWKVFWQRRYAELKKEGMQNPDSYDYKIDWQKYWTQYLKDYYDNKIRFYKLKITKDLQKESPISISSSETSIIGSSSDSETSLRKRRTKKRKESFSSVSSDSLKPRNSEISIPKLATNNEPITLLSVCRKLLVLDTELGSMLSNKILELVSQIINFEKIQANASDEFLINSDNVTFLETVKEKLKGLISADLFEPKKLCIAKECVQKIAQLIHQNPVNFLDNEIIFPELVNTETSDKLNEIILKALETFGKTDTSPEELEIITEIYLEELSKNIDLALKSSKKLKNIPFQELDNNEIKCLIKNFTRLSNDEQAELIDFVKELEQTDSERMKILQDGITENNSPKETIVLDEDDEDYDFNELVSTLKD